MKYFSKLFEAVSAPSVMFHITPTANVPSILENGLLIGVRRSTAGIETQKKIYLTTSSEYIPNLFPNMFGWEFKDLSILKVDVSGLQSHMSLDPEYEGEVCWMCDSDIEPNRIENLGQFTTTKIDANCFLIKLNPDTPVNEATLKEVVVKRGDKWLVMTHDKSEILGSHDSEEEALSQLAAIEISKHKK